MMRFLDLFAGIGGFRLGLERAGHECVGHVEIDKYARKSYEAMHETDGEWTRNDITTITNEEWAELKGSVDIIAGGFPCQSFSIAGKRGGFEDTRGTLFFDVARAAKEIEPSYLFLENVKGLFSHDKGRTFGTIIQTLDELGYITEWGLFNSKFWGVPQNRERVFIVATRKDVYKKPILFDLLKQQELNGVNVKLRDVLEQEVDEKFYLSKEQTERLVFNMSERDKAEDEIKILAHRKNYRRNTQVFDKDGLTETLDTGQGGGRGHYTMEEPFIIDDQGRLNKKLSQTGYEVLEPHIKVVGTTNPNRHSDANVMDIEGISPTISARDYKGPKQILEVAIGASGGRNPENPSDRTVGAPTEQRLEINKDGTSNTLTSVQKDNYVVEEYRVLRKVRNEYGKAIREQYEAGEVDERIGNMYDMLPRKDEISNTISTVQKDNYVVERNVKKIGNIYPSGGQAGKVYDPNGISVTVTGQRVNSQGYLLVSDNLDVVEPPFRIRKLTPLECFRLQGFPDELFYKAQEVNSNSQLYKQAGNSVTVNVIEAIAKGITKHELLNENIS